MSTNNHDVTPRIYVACLAAYNNGKLHGVWIDANQDVEEIQNEIARMLKASPEEGSEEYAIHDYEGFEGAPVEEYQSIESVVAIAGFIETHGALGGKLLEYFCNLDDAKTAIEDNYAGEFASLTDFARELTEETTTVPENLIYYIDYDAMARDLEINDVLTMETGFEKVHVFWRH
jgi:antirestriction protein